MDEQIGEKRALALEFLKSNNAGVLATAGHDNIPHASAVYYVADDNFNIYFVTKGETRKYAALKAHPEVAFVVGVLNVPRTLQIEGTATELTDKDEIAARAPELMRNLESNDPYHIPFAKMDGNHMAVIWIQPKWIRWGDFSGTALGNENIFTEIPLQ